MGKLIGLTIGALLFFACSAWAYEDCCEVAVRSYDRAVSQGYPARIVVGQVWGKPERFRHAEAQVLLNGEWVFVDNGTGKPLVGWYGKHIVGPAMDVEEAFPNAHKFSARYVYDREMNAKYQWSVHEKWR